MKNIWNLLNLYLKICWHDSCYFTKEDVMLANEFYSFPGMDWIAGLSDYGVTLPHPEPKSEILSYLKGE